MYTASFYVNDQSIGGSETTLLLKFLFVGVGGWGCNSLNPSPGSASAWGSGQISVYMFSANEKQSQNQSFHFFRCEALLKIVYAISTENNFYIKFLLSTPVNSKQFILSRILTDIMLLI